MAKMKEFFKNHRHYRMERFSAIFIVLVVLFSMVTVMCFVKYIQKQNVDLSTKAMYTTEFRSSRTDAAGDVVGIYTSKDKTKALALLKFDDIRKVSTNAKNYQAFLTGAKVQGNDSTLHGTPSGSIYMFGNSGYMGIYLVNNASFDSQVLDLVIRANSELVAPNSADSDKAKEDKSFAEHDQIEIFFNPGASEVKSLDVLDAKGVPSVSDLYKAAVITDQEADIHKKLSDHLKKMQVDLNNIAEYTDRLLNTDGVQVPEAPAQIKGDKIEESGSGDNKVLTYKPASVLPGGYDIDWQNKSVTDGFLNDLIKKTDTPMMTYEQFFAQKNKESKVSSDFKTDMTWVLKDGTALKDIATGSSKDRYTTITNDIQELTSAWSTYYSDKRNYQVSELTSLLELESDIANVKTSASVNASDDVLICY